MSAPENPVAREYFVEALRALAQNPDEFFAHGKQLYDGGDRRALAAMIYFCAQLNWALPAWAVEAFVMNYQKLKAGEFESWDDLLGPPHPKGRHISGVKTDSRTFSVHSRCRKIIEQENAPIDPALFERVGEEFGIGASKCRDLYYDFEKIEKVLRPARDAGLY